MSHATAAWLHGLGEVNPEPLTFTHPVRRQTRKGGLRFVRASIGAQEVMTLGGLPVTTMERTILDLLSDGEDLSLLSAVLRDAMRADPGLDSAVFASRIDGYAKAYGYADGCSLYKVLRK